jgi:hypothetical protein
VAKVLVVVMAVVVVEEGPTLVATLVHPCDPAPMACKSSIAPAQKRQPAPVSPSLQL